MKDSQTGSLYSLVATAATDGVDAAVREGERTFSDDRARASALQTAAQTLTLARRYPEAAALMERAGRQTDNPAALLSMAEMLRRARRHEEIVLPPDQPATPGRRLLALTVGGKLDVKQVAALFSRDLAPEILKTGPQTQRAGRGGARPGPPAAPRAGRAGGRGPRLRARHGAGGGQRRRRLGLPRRLLLPLQAERHRLRGLRRARRRRVPDRGAQHRRLDARRRGPAARRARRPRRGAEVARLGAARRSAAAAMAAVPAVLAMLAMAAAAPPIRSPQNPFAVLWTPGSAADAGEIRCAAAVLRADRTATAPRSPPSCAPAAIPPPTRRGAAPSTWPSPSAPCRPAASPTWRTLPGGCSTPPRAPSAPRSSRPWPSPASAAGTICARSPRGASSAPPTTGGPARSSPRWRSTPATSTAPRRSSGSRSRRARRRRTISTSSPGCCSNADGWTTRRSTSASARRRSPTTSRPAFLHTLACLYAEQGRTAEAYRIILQSIGARADEAPSAEDWYVFGRLAEQYGLPDVARKYYRKVARPEEPGRRADVHPRPGRPAAGGARRREETAAAGGAVGGKGKDLRDIKDSKDKRDEKGLPESLESFTSLGVL